MIDERHLQDEHDEPEKGPLADRLERLKWPEAPPELRERGLRELMERLEADQQAD